MKLPELNPESMIDPDSVNFSIVMKRSKLNWLVVGGVIPLVNITFKSINGIPPGWILTEKISREETNICC